MDLQPWTRAMVEVLSDRDWHPIREVWAAGAEHVPPGVAHRENKRGRDRSKSIDAGRRRKARDALRSLTRRGNVERDDDRVRLVRPPQGASCPTR